MVAPEIAVKRLSPAVAREVCGTFDDVNAYKAVEVGGVVAAVALRIDGSYNDNDLHYSVIGSSLSCEPPIVGEPTNEQTIAVEALMNVVEDCSNVLRFSGSGAFKRPQNF